MPKSRKIAAYTSRYFDLLETVLSGQAVSLRLPRARATSMRHDFYGWRNALRAEGHPDARRAEGIQVSLSSTGELAADGTPESLLSFQSTEHSEETAQLDRALADAGIAPGKPVREPPPPPVEATPNSDSAEDALSSLGYIDRGRKNS